MVTPTDLKSCLYVGRVRHRRFTPVRNDFTYSGAWLYLDLSELDRVFSGRWLWSTHRPALARFRREDHLLYPADIVPESLVSQPLGSTGATDVSLGLVPDRDTCGVAEVERSKPPAPNQLGARNARPQPPGSLPPLDECVRDLVFDAAGFRPNGPIRLLTQPRYFGYAMNPVSFYYCYDKADEDVTAVVAEVNNTPWRERHCYVLTPSTSVTQPDSSENESSDSVPERLRFRHPKRFHVSPFMQMDMDYHWSLGSPGRSLTVHIENHQRGSRLFDCTLHLKRQPLTGPLLAKSLVRHPFMTGKIIAAIHWQALRLWWKGCPVVPHPGRPEPASVASQSDTKPSHRSDQVGPSSGPIESELKIGPRTKIEPSMETDSSDVPQNTEAVAP